MAKNKNSYEKRRKEMKRMQKAQEKRERRLARKMSPDDAESPDGPDTELDADLVEEQPDTTEETDDETAL